MIYPFLTYGYLDQLILLSGKDIITVFENFFVKIIKSSEHE
jgi:hypothetical protein